jgi:hypothetical protein
MEKINNLDTIKECSKVLGHQVENIPELDTSKIHLVSNINPKMLRRTDFVKDTTLNNATTITLHTCSTVNNTYLTFVNLCFIKDVTSTATVISLNCMINGIITNIIKIPTITLTAQDGYISDCYPIPIKLDRGSVIKVTADTNTANIRAMATIGFYEVEDQRTL